MGVKGTNLNEIKLRRYLIVSKEYPKKDVGSVEKLIMDLNMSNRVQFLISTTPFCSGVPRAINWDIILVVGDNLSNQLGSIVLCAIIGVLSRSLKSTSLLTLLLIIVSFFKKLTFLLTNAFWLTRL